MPKPPPATKEHPEPRSDDTRAIVGWVLLALVLAAPLWHLHVITRVYLPVNHSDLLPVWSGTRAALNGQDPYSESVVIQLQKRWYEDAPQTIIHPEPQEFWYPAHIIVLFAPFASLSWTTERLLYLTIVPPLLALVFWNTAGVLEPGLSFRTRLLVAAVALFSWPVIWGVRLQQMSVVVMLLVLLAWYLLAREQQIAPGILLALSTIKPQLVLLLLVWILLWAVTRSMWRLIASFTGAVAMLLVAAQWILPGWIPHWLAVLRQYQATTHSRPQLQTAVGHWPGLAIGAVIIALVLIGFVRLRRCAAGSRQFNLVTALALAAAVLVAPFNPPIIYNYCFLFPAVVLILFHKLGNRFVVAARLLLILQLAFDLFAPAISALGESLAGSSSLWTVLPFLDFLLPSIATATLLLEIWSIQASLPRSPESLPPHRAVA
ncbi:MAG TPA: glycosyltransferase family 87 protein [Acidobacteriaceae bacterium]|nr:glycosyltransferase family 87 protein [Acidobacteriaceae bacterium]